MTRTLATVSSTQEPVTWKELTERLARHLTNLNRASSHNGSYRAEMRRWARELTFLQGRPTGALAGNEVKHDR